MPSTNDNHVCRESTYIIIEVIINLHRSRGAAGDGSSLRGVGAVHEELVVGIGNALAAGGGGRRAAHGCWKVRE